MKHPQRHAVRRNRYLLASAAALVLSACGGGGDAPSATPDSAPAPSEALPAPPVVFSGVAATGAPLARASVQIFDRAGTEACATTADVVGHYSCTLENGVDGPFVVVAKRDEQVLYSTASSASSATVNVTPLTTLIVARLSPTGDPSSFRDAIKADPSIAGEAKVQAKVDELKVLLAPLLTAVGDTLDPIKGSFAANGSGHDKVLDSLQVTIRPEGASSNIQITVKAVPTSDNSPPLQLAFKSTDVNPSALTAAIPPASLVGDGVAAKVADLMQRLTDCYALPLAQRIANVSEGAVVAAGTASSIVAPACKSLFVDSDPGTYKDNGLLIGSSAAFPGMFREGSTGVVFDRGNFEYQYANGDLFLTFRTTSVSGSVVNQYFTVRKQSDRLMLIGNQMRYDAAVRPYVVDREFPLQPQYSYFGSGYNVQIPNRIDASTGLPLFQEAKVTAPNGRVMTYRPSPGRSTMGIVRADDSVSGTSVEYLAAAFQDPATAGNPAQADSTLIYADPQSSDIQIAAIADQGVWTVEWIHADSDVANVVQSYRTISRAPTVAETRQLKFAQMTPAYKETLLADSNIASAWGIVFGAPSAESPNVADISAPGGTDAWMVPDGAVAPTSISVFGRSPTGISANDNAQVSGSDRSTVIRCTPQSFGDNHCDSSTGTTQFALNSKIWVLEFWGRSARQVEMAKIVATYKLTP